MLAPPPPHPKVLLAESEDGPGYSVTVLPPQAIGHDRCFDDYLNARAYARLLRFGHGWQLVDRCDERVKKAVNG